VFSKSAKLGQCTQRGGKGKLQGTIFKFMLKICLVNYFTLSESNFDKASASFGEPLTFFAVRYQILCLDDSRSPEAILKQTLFWY